MLYVRGQVHYSLKDHLHSHLVLGARASQTTHVWSNWPCSCSSSSSRCTCSSSSFLVAAQTHTRTHTHTRTGTSTRPTSSTCYDLHLSCAVSYPLSTPTCVSLIHFPDSPDCLTALSIEPLTVCLSRTQTAVSED